MVIHDLRHPIDVQDTRHIFSFGLRHQIRVAVVVMAHVLVVEPWNAASRPLQRVRLAHVPVGEQLVPVGVRMCEQNDHVVENAPRLAVVHADHLVDRLDELLGSEDLRCVQPSIDPDHGLTRLGQGMGLVLVDTLGQRETARDLSIFLQARVVLGRRHDRHQLRAIFSRTSDLLEYHPRGLGGEFLPVRRHLRVARELVVRTDFMPKVLLGRGDGLGCERTGREHE